MIHIYTSSIKFHLSKSSCFHGNSINTVHTCVWWGDVVNCIPFGMGSTSPLLGLSHPYISSSFVVSGGCVFIVNIFLKWQFAEMVKLSMDLNVWPLNVSPTSEFKSRQRLSHTPRRSMLKGNLAWSGVTVSSLLLEDKNILRLLFPMSTTPSSKEKECPKGTIIWRIKYFWIKNKDCFSSFGILIFVVADSPSST